MRAYRAMNKAQAKLYPSSSLELSKDVACSVNYILDNYFMIDAFRLN